MPDSTKQLKLLFKQSRLIARRKNCRQAAIFGGVFMLVGACLDAVVYPELLLEFLVVRVFCGVLLVLFGLAITRMKSDLISLIVVHVVGVLPLAGISYMIAVADGAASSYYAGLNLVLMGATLLLRWTAIDSAVNMVLCLLFYGMAVMVYGNTWREAFVPGYFIFVTGAIACAGTYFFNQGRFREFCLSKDVQDGKDQLEKSFKQLQAMDETKSRFFANISHELRTPLTLILGPAENLRSNGKYSKDVAFLEHLDTIEDNALRLLRLINDILDLVKLDSDEAPPRPETVNVTDFIHGITSHLRAIAALKNIDISCTSSCLEQEVVWLDRDRLEKIVLNLAVNAVKFTPPGGKISLGAETKDGNLYLSVVDNGQGMSKEDLENIFVRFWQADMSARRRHRGAGIGLALVKSLTDSMQGEISVSSEINKGTNFKIMIPAPMPETGALVDRESNTRDVLEKFNEKARLSGVESVKETVASERGALNTLVSNVPQETRRKRVLVADDEDAMRNFIARQLDDYEVLGARDGAEAWEIVQQEPLDLIILDLMMPGMDGIEVTTRIRSLPATSRIPIILVTAQASEVPRLNALEAGVNDFMSKPFSVVELRVRVRNLIASSEFEFKLAKSNVNLETAYEKLKEQRSILVQTEKLSSLGRMSAGIVHEVNNPLNYAKTALHALKSFDRQIPAEERDDFLEVLGDAQEGVSRVIGIVSDLRSFTRGDAAAMSRVVVKDMVESARRLSSQTLSGIRFDVDISPDLEINGNDGQLCQLFMNLFQNSARAIMVRGNGPEPQISVQAEERENGSVAVRVRDNGCGISKDDIEHMFEPFFTKNDVGEGMGLGLSICHRIIKQHGAEIDVKSEVGLYTEITIFF
ncbi:histidine kinase [Oceaniferula spumae]|uniref:histidine kinase n=1 Tax=Oceaniferula spumae TaxID=2979115 RepID=A0AAT9FJ61_9BACT